jgi:putative oxidoreductase
MNLESLGLRPGRLHAQVAGVSEMSGGVLLLLGLTTPLAAGLGLRDAGPGWALAQLRRAPAGQL